MRLRQRQLRLRSEEIYPIRGLEQYIFCDHGSFFLPKLACFNNVLQNLARKFLQRSSNRTGACSSKKAFGVPEATNVVCLLPTMSITCARAGCSQLPHPTTH
jgi:hypothetical protein